MAKKFDGMAWFNGNGHTPVVTINAPIAGHDGKFKFKLEGDLPNVTAESIAELVESQEDDVKVSLPKAGTDGGIKATRSKSFDTDALADMVLKTEDFFTADKADDDKTDGK